MKIISKPRVFMALSVLCCFVLQNCATTFIGKPQTIPVTSNPPGAKVTVDGAERGLAPLLLQLVRDKGHVLRIEKDGYQPFEIRITSSVSSKQRGAFEPVLLAVAGAFLGVFIGGAFGLATYKVIPEEDTELQYIGACVEIGAVIGAVALAAGERSAHKLDPNAVNITLTKIGEKAQASFLVIEAEELANIRWIRIRYSDGGAEEIMDLNRTRATEKIKERDGCPGKGLE